MFSIITTEANMLMQEIYDRMPVILDKNDLATWLDAGTDQERVLSMLKPCPNSWIETYPVSSRVNSVKNNGQACLEKMAGPLN
jgi:putative SOS response-associated peptidase YedK